MGFTLHLKEMKLSVEMVLPEVPSHMYTIVINDVEEMEKTKFLRPSFFSDSLLGTRDKYVYLTLVPSFLLVTLFVCCCSLG